MDKKEIKEITKLLEDADAVIVMIDGTVALCGGSRHLLAGLSTIIHSIRVDTNIEDKDILKAVNMAMENDEDDLDEKIDKISEILKMMKEVMNK